MRVARVPTEPLLEPSEAQNCARPPLRELSILPRAGEMIDRYRVIAEWAHGGMAAVYAVHRTTGVFDKLLAMKLMLPNLAHQRRFVDMFVDEARIAAQIHHPNVVQVFDVGAHGATPFLVMEFLRGKSLAQVLARNQRRQPAPLTRAMVFSILAAGADGLHAAHEARGPDNRPLEVVHRDVSYQNVYVGYDGHVKVVDFGIADAAGRISQTRTGEIKGKLEFMAPEQIDRRYPISRQTDVWALGVMAWQIFAGRKLFRGQREPETMWNVLNRRVGNIGQIDTTLPTEVADTIMSCLERHPSQRPADMRAVADVFREAAGSLGSCPASDVAAAMKALFAGEQKREDEVIAAALARSPETRELMAAPPADGEEAESESEVTCIDAQSEEISIDIGSDLVPIEIESYVRCPTTHSDAGPNAAGTVVTFVAAEASAPSVESGRRPFWKIGGVLGLLVCIVAVTAAELRIRDEQAPSSSESLAPPTPASKSSQVTSAQLATTAVTLEVDGRARLALVDGVRHDERPLQLEVPVGGAVEVLLVGPNSEKSWQIGELDGGRKLTLPVAAPDPSVRPPQARAHPRAEESLQKRKRATRKNPARARKPVRVRKPAPAPKRERRTQWSEDDLLEVPL